MEGLGDTTLENRFIGQIERYRDAYLERDVEALLELFADDAEVTVAVGTFRGRAAIRRVLEADAQLSPTAAVRDAGIGVVASEHTVVWERLVSLPTEGIPYERRIVTVFELDDGGLIHRLRSYFD